MIARWVSAAATLLLISACVEEAEIVLSADREEISAGGTDFATITAHARLSGVPVDAGTVIEFDTSAGSFASTTLETSKDVPADSTGAATIRLYSCTTIGSATVTANFLDEASGYAATGSISIRCIAPPG